jgi:hypothetical protein
VAHLAGDGSFKKSTKSLINLWPKFFFSKIVFNHFYVSFENQEYMMISFWVDLA